MTLSCVGAEDPAEIPGRASAHPSDFGGGAADLLAATAEQKLLASDPTGNLSYGGAIALSGDRAIVGAYGAIVGGVGQGSAYLLSRSAGVWSQEAQIVGADTGFGDGFGGAVAISGDTAIVGATGVDLANAVTAGAAYVFVRSNGAWAQQAKLVASDATTNALFGTSVAIAGDTAIVGARGALTAGLASTGAAYVFVRSNGVWTQQSRLVSGEAAAQNFGYSVALSGGTALIGWSSAATAGAADVFVGSGAAWAQEASLTASDGAAGDNFGYSVALSGDTALVGAFGDDNAKGVNAGAAYVFTRTAGAWSQQAKLLANNGAGSDYLGTSVALSGDVAVVGAYYQNTVGGIDAGEAHVYSRAAGVWTEQSPILAGDAAPGDDFAYSVAVEGDTVASGALLGGDAQSPNAGAAYFYLLRASNGDPCADGAGCASGFCVDGVCCDAACGGGVADCQACSVAAGASVNGQCAILVSGAVCRPSAGPCDVEETCAGGVVTCPADALAPDGTPCAAGTCLSGVCDTGGAGGVGGGGAGGSVGGGGAGGSVGGGGAGGGGNNQGGGGNNQGGGGNSQGGGGQSGDGGDTAGSAGAGASVSGEGPGASGGCGCRTAGDTSPSAGVAPLFVLALASLLAGRRRRGDSSARRHGQRSRL